MVAQRYSHGLKSLLPGHWLDSIGNSINVTVWDDAEFVAVITPLIDHQNAKDRVLRIKNVEVQPFRNCWCMGRSRLEELDHEKRRLVWMSEDGRPTIWSRGPNYVFDDAFPWLLNPKDEEPWLPLDEPRDVLYDGARVAALLDIRQMLGAHNEPQERLTHILMDHDLHPNRRDYLIPAADSPLWATLDISEALQMSIRQRISKIPTEALSQRISWNGHTEVLVGHHRISCRARDVQILQSRWEPRASTSKDLEIARLLALYSVFDNPLSNRRNGVHLGLDPEIRRHCDFELFASPLNAAVCNGHFASKWPHIEHVFGSIGCYPFVLEQMPVNSVVCVNPPFTEAYLDNVMARLAELKLRFRLRMAIPIIDAPWRAKLMRSLPEAQLLKTYYDASGEGYADVLHPTLLWEDPRCPPRPEYGTGGPAAISGSPAMCFNGRQ